MRVKFKTNLDWYKSVSWPDIDQPPRIGESVNVVPQSESFCNANKIPQRLKVVDVTYHYDRVEVELWYDSNQLSLMTQQQLNHLYKQ